MRRFVRTLKVIDNAIETHFTAFTIGMCLGGIVVVIGIALIEGRP